MGIKQVERIAGSDRYRTSIEIAKKFFASPDNILFANGDVFIDALPGSPLAAKLNGPIILTKANEVAYPVEQWLSSSFKSIPTTYFLGGNQVISEETRVNIQTIILANL
ncbi:cell wall-binding repeat-containing protein [Bacillus coahuilensis]|uniref:cell wall-binding repeat-containing protein n=1 Tax=Bacillus coahuilensis TaxID=408580 RepID=UPI0009D76BE6